MRFRPLLGEPITAVSQLRLPAYGSLKYDGIRGLVLADSIAGRFDVFTRKLKLVPSDAVRKKFAVKALCDIEGELIYGDPTAPDCMSKTTQAVMGNKKPWMAADVRLFVFDFFRNRDTPYERRYELARQIVRSLGRSDVVIVEQKWLTTGTQAIAFEQKAVEAGLEGVMFRDPTAPYKCGRSTLEEQYLLKWKRFEDGEAQIVSVEEGESNQNEQVRDERGYSKRSKKAEGMRPNGTLGRMWVRDEKNFPGIKFAVGSGPGLTLEERARLWSIRTRLPEKWIKYRFQRVGTKDAPRFPRFVSLRDKRDF